MKTRRWIAGLGSMTLVAMALGASVPAYAYASHPTMKRSTIEVNGTKFSSQYEFTYNGTTYMPIWYVMQVLNRIKGVSTIWNGNVHQWTIQDNKYSSSPPPKFSINAKGGQTSIFLDGENGAKNIVTLVAEDPKTHVMTTYMPIWYIQQVLNVMGFTDKTNVWNGARGVWNLDFTLAPAWNSGASTSPSLTAIYLVMGEFMNASDTSKTIPGYSPLATKTQWYPNPSDVFFNKQFPLSDLKNNKVLQTKPFVIMMNDGPSGGTPSWIALQYVGKGPNSQGAETSYWMGEQVNAKGTVKNIYPNLLPFPQSSFPTLNVPASGGYHFKGNPPHTYWGVGGNLFMVPNPGWTPLTGG